MTHRMLFLVVSALALAFWAAGPAPADDTKSGTHDGYVVKAGDGRLTMTTAKGAREEHTHVVAMDAKITCDGKECKLEDLKKGDHVTVTQETKGDKKMVTKIVAKRAGAERR
ncbi:MAG TPA: hypothetical protein VKD90_03385 [Gemmataceae bacterium]|nr:hypothetical protein [Gemmataceae bacterium]